MSVVLFEGEWPEWKQPNLYANTNQYQIESSQTNADTYSRVVPSGRSISRAHTGPGTVDGANSFDSQPYKYASHGYHNEQEFEQQVRTYEYDRRSTLSKVLIGVLYGFGSLIALYFFMVAVKWIGIGFTIALGCNAKNAFAFTDNPIAGLMIGTIVTAIVQSSSTVTSLTVALVAAQTLTIRNAVFIVMGANIGTCLTCIIVAFGQVADRKMFERAMAAATVHDMYNLWSVLIMFPLEIFLHPLEYCSVYLSKSSLSGGEFHSPVETVLEFMEDLLVVVDENALENVALGNSICTGDSHTSFIKGGLFYNSGLSDTTIGIFHVTLGLVLLVIALLTLVKALGRFVQGATQNIIQRMLSCHGAVNIIVGGVLTILVHSSSIVTSTLTPLAGLGVITLEQAYPIVIGANVGTCATALLAAIATGKNDGLAIAMVHLLFNIWGIGLFYVIAATRKPIIDSARALAFVCACWPHAAGVFIAFLFIIFPGTTLILVMMSDSSSNIVRILSWMIIGGLVMAFIIALYWYYKRGGKESIIEHLERKGLEREQITTFTLHRQGLQDPDDWNVDPRPQHPTFFVDQRSP